jgi:hypothetical protein
VAKMDGMDTDSSVIRSGPGFAFGLI